MNESQFSSALKEGKDYLKNGQIKKSLDILYNLLNINQSSNNSEFQDEVILISSRYSQFHDGWLKGIIDNDSWEVRVNKITLAVLNLIKLIEKENQANTKFIEKNDAQLLKIELKITANYSKSKIPELVNKLNSLLNLSKNDFQLIEARSGSIILDCYIIWTKVRQLKSILAVNNEDSIKVFNDLWNEYFSSYNIAFGSYFKGMNLKQYNFKGRNFSEATFDNALIQKIDFSSKKLSLSERIKAYFEPKKTYNKPTNLRMSSFRGCQILESTYLNAYLIKCNISNSNIHKSSFSKANLSLSDMSHSKIKNSTFFKSNLFLANLKECVFDSCDLRNSYLIQSNMNFIKFYSSDLSRADLRGVSLIGAVFNNCNLKEAVAFHNQKSALIEAKANVDKMIFVDYQNLQLDKNFANFFVNKKLS